MLAGTAAVCLVVAGCGGSDQTTAAFKSGYVRASMPIERTGIAITRAVLGIPHQTDARIAAEFADLANSFDTEVITLEALKAPASVSSAFTTVTAAANRLDDDLRAISVGASRHDGRAARAGVAAILNDAGAMNSGAATIRKKLGIK